METKINYNLQPLEHFFNEETTPGAIAGHLELLLQFLVFYSEKTEAKALDLYDVYCDILEFKQILQKLTTE